ncbi:MAG: hypothetical protein BIFFINMI_01027 [Phycisphaerae bacterium]|nr:hypothetical protein [Phycisphaerae bacterium]
MSVKLKFKIDGVEHEAPEGRLIIEACADAGVHIPRYCYHAGLSIVGSCRLCLVELEGQPKLLPSCQTPVREGINVLTGSEKVIANRRAVMEYLLINHPLDCPVCDQAGECWLQDYSRNHGNPASRFVEPKIKQPKKDVGRHTLLYQDRCVMCSRCVRFTREVAGTAELSVVQRGSRAEIDIFPGQPLDNKLSGNVVDLCPVGALLDKDFLHSQRVWFLQSTPSVCPGCSLGCNIRIDHNKGQVWRLKPRANLKVNDYWMCDEGRHGWKYVHGAGRLDHPARVWRGGSWEEIDDAAAAEVVRYRLADVAGRSGPGALAAVLSPMWTTEEQFLLARLVRGIDPQATLAVGPVPLVGRDETFRSGFTIYAEKCPNLRGARRVLAAMGGPQATFDELIAAVSAGKLKGLYLGGGYPPHVPWPPEPAPAAKKKGDDAPPAPAAPTPPHEKLSIDLPPGDADDWARIQRDLSGANAHDGAARSLPILARVESADGQGNWLTAAAVKALSTDGLVLIVHDLYAHAGFESADIVLAGGSWAEKTGTFVNVREMMQLLRAAPVSPEFARPEGELLWQAGGGTGAMDLSAVWEQMKQAGVAGYPPEAAAEVLAPANPYAGL